MRKASKVFRVTKINEDIHFTPKGPWEPGRATFSLLKGEYGPGGRKKSEKILTPFIHDLNERFKRGEVSVDMGRAELEAYRDELYRQLNEKKLQDLNQSNVDLIRSFIKNSIDTKVDILPSSRRSQVDSVWRLGRMMGKNSIATASFNEIQRVLNTIEAEGSFKGEFRTARALLKFIHRHADADRLKMKKFPPKEPSYLTREQLEKLIQNIPAKTLATYPAISDLILIIYNLGTRVGEALALESTSVLKRNGVFVVKVATQLSRKDDVELGLDRIRGTKNKRVREVVPLNWEEFKTVFGRWLRTCPTIDSREPYRTAVSKTVHNLCIKLFGIKEEEGASTDTFAFERDEARDASETREYKGIHMLRASHARVIVELTGNETFAANQIGDNPEVLRKHYSGRTNSEKAMAAFAQALKSN